MDKAKQAVSGFMAKAGHHDTTVHERVAPAVQNETVTAQRHENVQTAVDREVHQDHYHTSVQPVKDREVLPEQHTHNMVPVEHREHHHGNDRDVSQRLEQEAAQFKNQTTRQEGATTTSAAPTVQGEHVHHHVHETIQPVVHKETIQPHVTHTTVPIHEVHHNAAQHHSASALPAVSMGDFKKQGGSLTGREERYDGFEGEPRSIGHSLGHSKDHTGSGLSSDRTGTQGLGQSGTTGSGLSSDRSGTSGLGSNTGSSGVGSNTGTSGLGHTGSNTSSSGGKPGLMAKLNPKVDADGDGKAGFMK